MPDPGALGGGCRVLLNTAGGRQIPCKFHFPH